MKISNMKVQIFLCMWGRFQIKDRQSHPSDAEGVTFGGFCR